MPDLYDMDLFALPIERLTIVRHTETGETTVTLLLEGAHQVTRKRFHSRESLRTCLLVVASLALATDGLALSWSNQPEPRQLPPLGTTPDDFRHGEYEPPYSYDHD